MTLQDFLKSFANFFGLSINDAGVFCRTQWQFPWVVWLVYRLLLAIYYVAFMSIVFLYLIATKNSIAAYALIYLTDWTAVLVSLYMAVAFMNMFIDRIHGRYYHTNDRNNRPSIALSWRHKLQWCLLNIYMNISIMVTLVFWIFIDLPLPLIFNLTCHTFPSIFGVLEVLLTPIPVKLQHVIYPILYGAIYLVFTLIYYAAGGTDPNGATGIYPGILDYAHPRLSAITIVCVGVGVLAIQVFLWVLYKGKMAVVKCTMPTYVCEHSESQEYREIQNDESEQNVSQLEKSSDDCESNAVEAIIALPTVSNEDDKNEC